MNKLLLIFIFYFYQISIFSEKIDEDIYINSENMFYDKNLDTITLGEDSLIDYHLAQAYLI